MNALYKADYAASDLLNPVPVDDRQDDAPAPAATAGRVPAVVLDAAYFLAHFWTVVDSVSRRYRDMLTAREHAYVADLRGLSSDALTVYVRLINRKGPCFRVAKLSYLPPVSLHNALTELAQHGLVTAIDSLAQCDTLLDLFTLPELKAHISDTAARKRGKAALCAWLQDAADWPDVSAALMRDHAIIAVADSPWLYFKFLYFGHLTDNLSDFVVQELGHVKGETIDADHLAPLFATRTAADDCFRLHRVYQAFRTVRTERDGPALATWWHAQALQRERLHASAHDVYDRLVGRLGRMVERADPVAAVRVYRDSLTAPSRERLIKLLLKQGARDEALQLCAQGLAETRDAEERYALQQIWNRQHSGHKATQATRVLKDYPVLELDWSGQSVERAVLDHFIADGWQGVHSENWLWCNLFGLLFWDIIFDARHGDFHNPLQIAPSRLFKSGFCDTRRPALTERLALLMDRAAVRAHLRDCHDRKQGLSNPFVSWHPEMLDTLDRLLTHVPADGLAAVLSHMACDLGVGCHGFPDLFLWRCDDDRTDYRFVEVKSATDRILPQQFNWLQVFAASGVTMNVLRVHKPGVTAPARGATNPD